MNRFIKAISAIILVTFSVVLQTMQAQNVEPAIIHVASSAQGRIDNITEWELSAAVGAQAYLGEYDLHAQFFDWWAAPTADLSLKVWHREIYSYGVTFSFGRYKGLDVNGSTRGTFTKPDDEVYIPSGDGKYVTSLGYMYSACLTGAIDLHNLVKGKDFARPYSLAVSLSAGVVGSVGTSDRSIYPIVSGGLCNRFAFNERWLFDVTLRSSLVGDGFDGYGGRNGSGNIVPFDVQLGLSFGVSYRFGAH